MSYGDVILRSCPIDLLTQSRIFGFDIWHHSLNKAPTILLQQSFSNACWSVAHGATKLWQRFIILLNFFLQVRDAANAGATMLILGNNNANGYFRLDKDANAASPSIPAFSIPQSAYTQIFQSLQAGASFNIQVQDITLPTGMLLLPKSKLESWSLFRARLEHWEHAFWFQWKTHLRARY